MIVEIVVWIVVLVLFVALACVPGLVRAYRIRRDFPGGMSWRTAWARATPNRWDDADWSHLEERTP